MKISSAILLAAFVLLFVAMYASNVILKNEYNKIDKSDLYWTYGSILEQPFKHLKIEGGNITTIAYEPGKKSSVRVIKNWDGYAKGLVKAYVRNDTLYLRFPEITDVNVKRYMSYVTPVRIFSPELLSVEGLNTRVGIYKFRQKNISITLAGRSKVEVESYIHNFDSIHVLQRDSSDVVFEMSPDSLGKNSNIIQDADLKSSPAGHADIRVITPSTALTGAQKITTWEAMTAGVVDADIHGVSLLDIGHFQIKTLRLNISDTSGIILSGGSLRKFKK